MFDFNEYFEPASVEEAVGLLGSRPDARVIAGGTDVLIRLRERSEAFVGCSLVSVRQIPSLSVIRTDEEGNILIGSTASFTAVEENETVKRHLRAVAMGAAMVGGPQIRNMGTIGGNICNGATSADTAAPLFAYNAAMVIHGPAGVREIPIREFYLGPGKVALRQGDLVTAIKIRPEDYEGYKSHYIKFSPREAMDIATLSCAAAVKMDGEKVGDLRIAFGVAGPTPIRAEAAEAFARGLTIEDGILEQIGRKCVENTKARDSWRGTKAFRENLIGNLPGRAIRAALEA